MALQNFPDNAIYELDNLDVLRGMNSEQERKQMTDFRTERNAILQRYYGLNRAVSGRRPAGSIKQSDYLGIPIPVNLPFRVWGCCLVWKYSLNQTGHGMLTGGQDQLAHREAFIQAHGGIPEGMQINHLCNRPYCVQPAHLYAGDQQDNTDDRRIFNDPEYYYRIMALHVHPDAKFDDPLMKRVGESDRIEMAEPWDSPEVTPPIVSARGLLPPPSKTIPFSQEDRAANP